MVAAAACIVTGARQLAATRDTRDARAAADSAAAQELAIHEADIQFYAAKVALDPHGAQDRATLARLYLQHARETGAYDDNIRAESLARRSLQMRTDHNAPAYGILATALLAQHRFDEAIVAAESLAIIEPWVPSHRAMLGEIAFETGRYAMADTIFAGLRADAHKLDVAPRLARWAELHGQVRQARYLLHNAWTDARGMKHLPRETVAWFALRLGDLESRAGQPDSAERWYREGLALSPSDYRLLAAMARLNLARGDYRAAVRYGEDVIGRVMDPATLGVLSDAHAALGEADRAEELARVMELSVTSQDGPVHRQWELFLLDHGRSVDLIARKAEAELRSRKDVHGYDALAWARFTQGRLADARVAMDSALRLGTRDPVFERHRAAIDVALAHARGAASRVAAR